MTPPLKLLACAALLGAAALVGCNTSDSTSATASALTGTIDQASFPAAISAITVARNDGTTSLAAVLEDGTFSIPLESGGTYRLLLSADGASTPVVLDASGGRLRTEIQVSSGGGAVDLGTIRYWDPAAASLGSKSQALNTQTAVTTTTDGACVDGVISGTTQPCAVDTAPVDCTVANDMSNGCPDIGNTTGTDLAGTAATTLASANDADAAQPMGVPAQNAPAQILCASHGGGDHGPGAGHHHGGH